MTELDLGPRKSVAPEGNNAGNAPVVHPLSLYSLMAVVLIAGQFTKSFDRCRARCLRIASSCTGAAATGTQL